MTLIYVMPYKNIEKRRAANARARAKLLAKNPCYYKDWLAKQKEIDPGYRGEYYKEWHRTHDRYVKQRELLTRMREQYQCQNPLCPCAGQKLPSLVLDFHHVDRSTKLFCCGELKHSYDKLVAEIQKCCVLCAICHRMETNGMLDASGFTKCVVPDAELCGTSPSPAETNASPC